MDSFLDNIFSFLFEHIITPIINFIGNSFAFMLSSTFSKIFFALLFLNLTGFLLMYYDKKVAHKNGEIKQKFLNENKIGNRELEKEEKRALNQLTGRRTPESTLLLIALLGGSLGILGGMYKFHHKTQKQKFTIGVPVIIILHIILIVWRLISNFIGAK